MRARLMTCLVATAITFGGSAYLLTQPASASAEEATPKCQFGEVYACDPDRSYNWQGTCYSDDGCYYELEDCC